MRPAYYDNMCAALDAEGWYGLFRTSGGLRRVTALAHEVGATSPDSELTSVKFSFNAPADPFGRVTFLGIYHPELKPEPLEPAWT